MATYTTNYNLIKPDATDPLGDFRSDYNSNLDTIDANLGGGGGSGGHTIIDPNGSDMTQRTGLQFTGACSVSDDSVNDKTVVNITGGGSSSLAGLSDVNLTTPTDGQVLTYDNANSEWVNANPSGGGDSVSWNQIQASGTQIAEIEINGVTTNVYAPSGGGGGGSVNYSLTEQVVGTWIDSKPVYQKTLVGSNALSAHMVFAHGISNLGVLIKADTVLRADDNSYQIPVSTDQNNIEVEIGQTNIEIYINNDFLNFLGNGGYVMTLQYTKTTD